MPHAAQLPLLLAVLWLAAKLGGELALRLRMPAVVGELAAGMALAALHGRLPALPDAAGDPAAGLLAELGVLVLMFAVGLEATVPQMMRVGAASLRVAVAGVALPMAAGFAGARLLLPAGAPWTTALFIGACLCATSIGVSAQVLRERGRLGTPEGRVVLGAAVLDDVLGLLVLVAVSRLAAGGPLGWALLRPLALAVGFLAAALALGQRLARPAFRLATRMRSEQLLLPLALAFAFLLAWLGSLAGLAPIVGAYAAGLVLEPAHVMDLEAKERRPLEALVHPLVSVLAPVFFVVMGARVPLAALAAPGALGLLAWLAAFGTLGKWAAGFAAGRRWDPQVVGWGMVPRGEVGLIFVAAGAGLVVDGHPLLEPPVQAAVVGAIVLSTVLGPIGLQRALKRAR